MRTKQIIRISIDVLMTIALLFLMTYELIGQPVHEWLGIGIFVLFIIHHFLNGRWIRNILKGKYTPLRVWQTILSFFVLLAMVCSMVSGIIISRHALSFLHISGGYSFGRSLHMLSAYWGFVLMSLHLGFHWGMIMAMMGKKVKNYHSALTWVLRILALALAVYGTYAFVKREIGSYMFLRIRFVFFDSGELPAFFLLDYIAVMGLFIFISHYVTKILKHYS